MHLQLDMRTWQAWADRACAGQDRRDEAPSCQRRITYIGMHAMRHELQVQVQVQVQVQMQVQMQVQVRVRVRV